MRAILFASAALGLVAFGASAQEAAPPAEAPKATAPAVTVTDAEVAKFAAAALETSKLAKEHQAHVAAAADEAAKHKAQTDMSTAMGEAVVKAGFTVERYNEIARAAQADKALAERIARAAAPSNAQTSANASAPAS